VTIALGFVANDGLLLCADMEQTIGDIKTYDGKVRDIIFKEAAITVVGAGHVDYIQTAISAVVDHFPDSGTLPEVEEELRGRLLRFFDDHLARWASFPNYDRPSVELLIGVSGKKFAPRLFHYEGTAFALTSMKAIGSGVLLANDLMHRYCFGNYTINQLASLAIYILSKVKKGVVGCGGLTHITALRENRDIAWSEKVVIEKLEREFLKMEAASDAAFAKAITESPLSLLWLSEHRPKRNKGNQ
jgi:hypothetical protein